MRDVMEGEQYIFDRHRKYEKLKEILDQCEADWHAGQGPFAPDPCRPRIIISGAGLGGVAEKTVNVLEELGGAIVCYEGCSGISSRRRLVSEDRSRDPIVRIAEKYIEVPCAVVSPNTRRMEQVADTIDEWKADGVVSQRKGIPLLHIETDFTPGDEGQIRTRIEAYLEMIRKKKEEALYG